MTSKEGARRPRPGIALTLVLALWPMRPASGLDDQGAAPTRPPAGIVLVTAGEHGDFSRVVFALGSDLAYRTEPEHGGLRVVFPRANVGFDYSGVYPGRRAHRVIMAGPGSDADGTSFRLHFGCACSAQTLMLDGKLVVDVFDVAASGHQVSPSHATAPARADASPASDHSASGAAEPAASHQPAAAGDQPQPRPEFLERVDSMDGPAPSPPSAVVPQGAGFNPDHLQRMIAWAIEQGHLTEAGGEAAGPHASEGTQAPAANAAGLGQAEALAPAEQPALAPAAPEPQVASEPAAAKQEPTAEPARGHSCPDAFALDMAVAGGSGAFAAELARRQDALSRALAADHGVAAAQDDLAAFYLARLMPHEALQLLRTADGAAPTATRRWLEAVALALAGRAGAPAARALQAARCGGADIELWQAVLRAADGPLPRQTLENEAIALRLAAYAPALRVELALRLAEAGIHAKAPAAIARLLDIVEEAAPTDRARARLLFLRGRLAAARGDFAGARASWRGASHLPGEGGLRATLALLGSELEAGVLDEAEALRALQRLAYDWRGHSAELSIARLTAAIHEQQGDIALALRAIEEAVLGAEGRPGGRAAARLATDLMRRAYADASDLSADQLAVFWRYEGFVPPGPEGADLRLAFAQAMLVHGLPNAATGLLEPLARPAPGPIDDQVIELLAEAHLRANQPARTLEVLRTAATGTAAARPGRDLLAARALAALGRFAEAAGVLHGKAGEEAAQLQADYLWKAGLWRETAMAYRDLLRRDPEREADPESAVRLAAAAYMADAPELLGAAHGAAAAGDGEIDTSAFAPLPTAQRTGSPAAAAQLLDQAASLSGLAERYGLEAGQAPGQAP
jgi:hypothetical protein